MLVDRLEVDVKRFYYTLTSSLMFTGFAEVENLFILSGDIKWLYNERDILLG